MPRRGIAIWLVNFLVKPFCFRLHSSFSKSLILGWYVSTDMLTELARREKGANIKPDPDVDVFMKVSKKEAMITLSNYCYYCLFHTKKGKNLSLNWFMIYQATATEGQEANIVTDYMLKVILISGSILALYFLKLFYMKR